MTRTESLTASLSGRYRLERELGAGGMATVYLAHDLKHDRPVAIKVLKPELAAVLGAERFVQEIKTTAALAHPNILPLFDSGEAGGFLFYVMPYVEGETLRARLDRETQLGVEEAVKLVSEVADALQYAHEHGVVHRDIKPENILLHAGRPMVADFGIALAVSAAAGGRMTETGLSLGTPHYMSPEQATAEKTITNRSDIYSLGAVLYEMLTGEPPHTGTSAQQIIMKIVTEDVAPVTKLRKAVPPNVAAAVGKALEKLPADRFESARGLVLALQDPAFRTGGAGMDGLAGGAGRRGGRARLRDPWVLVPSVIAVGAIASSLVFGRRHVPQQSVLPPIQYVLTTTDSVVPRDGSPYPGAISPDGGTVVYSATGPSGDQMLYAIRTGDLRGRPIAGTRNGAEPYFSPDGAWVGFEQNALERKVRLDGGSPITIGSGVSNNGSAWTAGDEIVVGLTATSPGLSKVSAAGGTLTMFTHVDSSAGVRAHLWPIATPDANLVVFTLWYGDLSSSKLAIAKLDDGEVTALNISAIRPLAVLDGQLVYVQADGAVMAVPIDLRRRRVTGSPVSVHDPVEVKAGVNGNSAIFVSPGGGLVTARANALGRLTWTDASGTTEVAGAGVRAYTSALPSPDGRRILEVIGDGQGSSDVWLYDEPLKTLSRLTTMGTVLWARWTGDGGSALFVASDTATGERAVYLRPIAGGAAPARLYTSSKSMLQAVSSPDGKALLVTTFEGSWDIARVPLDSGSVARPYVATPFNEYWASFSPDRRWVTYMSDETGISEIYIASFSNPTTKVQISAGGGGLPEWSHDGSRVFYLAGSTGKAVVVAARVAYTPTLRLLSRDTVVRLGGNLSVSGSFGFTMSPEGKRALTIAPVTTGFQLVVAPNWITEFRRRLAEVRGGRPRQ